MHHPTTIYEKNPIMLSIKEHGVIIFGKSTKKRETRENRRDV